MIRRSNTLLSFPSSASGRKPGWGKGLKALLLASIIAVLFGVAASIVALAVLPDVGDAEARVAGVLRAHEGSDTGMPLPGKVAQSVVSIEDRRFYVNHGIDPVSLVRVAWSTLTTGSPQGGATISQQLAKVLYVDDDHTLGAKLLTAGLAVKLELRYSKAEVLEMYLNAVYYGDGHWGIAQASRGYFGKSPEALDWAEASLLAGLLQAPSAYDPTRHFDLARQRQQNVLAALVRDGVLTQTQAGASYAERIDLVR